MEVILEVRQTRAGRQNASNKRDFGVFDSLSHRVDSTTWKTGSSLSPLKSAHCACGRLVCADVSSSSSLVNISSTRHANHNTWLVETWSRKSATDPNKPTPNMRTRATLGRELGDTFQQTSSTSSYFDIFKYSCLTPMLIWYCHKINYLTRWRIFFPTMDNNFKVAIIYIANWWYACLHDKRELHAAKERKIV